MPLLKLADSAEGCRVAHEGKGRRRVSLRARSESCAATSRARLVIRSSASAPLPAANTVSPKPLPFASNPRSPACNPARR